MISESPFAKWAYRLSYIPLFGIFLFILLSLICLIRMGIKFQTGWHYISRSILVIVIVNISCLLLLFLILRFPRTATIQTKYGLKECGNYYYTFPDIKLNVSRIRTGKWEDWYENGNRRYVGQYANHVATGQWTYWYDNGNKRAEIEFNLNGEISKQLSLFEGVNKSYKRKGAFKLWHTTGHLCFEARFVNDNLDGEFKVYSSVGVELATVAYNDGIPSGVWQLTHNNFGHHIGKDLSAFHNYVFFWSSLVNGNTWFPEKQKTSYKYISKGAVRFNFEQNSRSLTDSVYKQGDWTTYDLNGNKILTTNYDTDKFQWHNQDQISESSKKKTPSIIQIELPNNKKMDFALIPSGEVSLSPSRSLSVKECFYISQYECTIEQWLSVMGTMPKFYKEENTPLNLPVTSVTASEIAQFINKLKDKRIMLRLPTEEEWEYACLAGNPADYFFGNDPNTNNFSPDTILFGQTPRISYFNQYAWDQGIHPVGLKRPNRWGLYDIYGNASELCQNSPKILVTRDNTYGYYNIGREYHSDVNYIGLGVRFILVVTPKK